MVDLYCSNDFLKFEFDKDIRKIIRQGIYSHLTIRKASFQ